MDLNNRKTGRTTKMLQQAIECYLKEKARIFIVTGNKEHMLSVKYLLLKILDESGFEKGFINNFRFIIYTNDDCLRGIDQGRVFIDHYTYDLFKGLL